MGTESSTNLCRATLNGRVNKRNYGNSMLNGEVLIWQHAELNSVPRVNGTVELPLAYSWARKCDDLPIQIAHCHGYCC